MRFRSSTHNTGAAPYLKQDYYTKDGSREAKHYEQQVHGKMLEAWRKDGQPKTGWYYDVKREKAGGRNAGRSSHSRR